MRFFLAYYFIYVKIDKYNINFKGAIYFVVTIKEIAEMAGVSRRTVDRVINHRGSVKPETEQKILKLIKELGYTPNAAGRSLAAHKKKFQLLFCSTKGIYSPIYAPVREGAKKKAAELNEYGVTTTFLTIDRDHPLSEAEIQNITSNLNYDGIAISPVDIPGIPEILEKASELKIPMVFYNVDYSAYERLCFIGCNYIKSGKIAAGLAAFSSNDCGKICILTAKVANKPSYSDRMRGFITELEERYPNMQILDTILLEGDAFDYYETIKKTLDLHPDINVIYLVNPGDYSACYAINKAIGKRKIRVITNDLMAEQIPLLKNGLISATVDQEPHRQGSIALETLFNYLAMGRMPSSDIIYTHLSILIGESM